MGIRNKMMLAIYASMLMIIGVLFTPYCVVWSPSQNLDAKMYIPLWKLVQVNLENNKYTLKYEINILRISIEIIVFVLVTLLLYWKRKDKDS